MGMLTKVFRSGNSQAVRLPRALRIPENVREVEVRKEGDKIVLEIPARGEFSKKFLSTLGSLPDFKRPAQRPTVRKPLFP